MQLIIKLKISPEELEVIMGQAGPKKIVYSLGRAKFLCPNPVILGQNRVVPKNRIKKVIFNLP